MTEQQEKVLTAYADCGMVTSKAAQMLFMHYNTVTNYLDRIREKTGFNPRNLFDLIKLLQMIGATDFVEITRCKDCIYSEAAQRNKNGFKICPASGMSITENDFCSHAERRDNV